MTNENEKVNKITFSSGGGRGSSGQNPFGFMGNNNGRSLAQSSFSQKQRINDYDSSILDSRSYLDMDDEMAKLEFQITEKEKNLAYLREKIKGSEQIAKVNEVLDLKIKEKAMEKELVELRKEYSKRSVTSKVKGAVINNVEKEKNFVIVDKIGKFISRKVLPKVSKKFEDITKLSSSLDTLQSINKNIDELIDMKVPFGEQTQNYEKLTAYLNRANKIHSQISKSMKKIG